MHRLRHLARQFHRWLPLCLALPLHFAAAESFDAEKAEASTYRIIGTVGKTGYSLGSGFLVNNNGYVVTNHHVVETASEIYVVQRKGETIRVWEAKIHAVDSSLDLAVLSAQGITGTPVVFAKEPPPKAAEVFAVGFPAQAYDDDETSLFVSTLRKRGFRDIPADPAYNGFVNASVKAGSIEAIRERKWGSRGNSAWVITHSAGITSGNSGGPLFARDGNLLGVNTMILGEGRSQNGVLLGNILRQSSLYTELETFLKRLGVAYTSASETAAITPPQLEKITPPAVPEVAAPPKDAGKNPSPIPKKADFPDFSKKGTILISVGGGLGILAILIMIFRGVGKKSSAQSPPPPPLASNHAAPEPDRNWLRGNHGQHSADIMPMKRRGTPPNPDLVSCQLSSTPESPVQMTLEISASSLERGYTLGRSSSSDYQIRHDSISRAHARISASPDGPYVTDLSSANGTFHNQHKISPKTGVLLAAGDTVRLGDVILHVDQISL